MGKLWHEPGDNAKLVSKKLRFVGEYLELHGLTRGFVVERHPLLAGCPRQPHFQGLNGQGSLPARRPPTAKKDISIARPGAPRRLERLPARQRIVEHPIAGTTIHYLRQAPRAARFALVARWSAVSLTGVEREFPRAGCAPA